MHTYTNTPKICTYTDTHTHKTEAHTKHMHTYRNTHTKHKYIHAYVHTHDVQTHTIYILDFIFSLRLNTDLDFIFLASKKQTNKKDFLRRIITFIKSLP